MDYLHQSPGFHCQGVHRAPGFLWLPRKCMAAFMQTGSGEHIPTVLQVTVQGGIVGGFVHFQHEQGAYFSARRYPPPPPPYHIWVIFGRIYIPRIQLQQLSLILESRVFNLYRRARRSLSALQELCWIFHRSYVVFVFPPMFSFSSESAASWRVTAGLISKPLRIRYLPGRRRFLGVGCSRPAVL